MASEQKLRETVIWLAGLLSTDGTVCYAGSGEWKTANLRYYIFSKDKKWLEKISERLSEIGITTYLFNVFPDNNRWGKIPGWRLHLHEPHKISKLLKKYANGFMIERKWKRVVASYSGKYLHVQKLANSMRARLQPRTASGRFGCIHG